MLANLFFVAVWRCQTRTRQRRVPTQLHPNVVRLQHQSQERPVNLETKSKLKNDLFLLNPANAAYLSGKWQRPARTPAGCMPLLVLPFLALGLVLSVMLVRENTTQQAVRRDGLPTTGTYIDKDINRNTEGDTYSLTYEYVVDGQTYRRTYSVGKRRYDRTEVGSTVEILYLPDDLGTSRLVFGNKPILWMALFLTIWNAIVLFILLWMGLRIWANIRLNRGGLITDGELQEIVGQTDGEGNYTITVKFTFLEPDKGDRINDETWQIRDDLKDQPLPPPGTRLAILYLSPQNYRAL